jgi:peptide/nickel transport system substrate-binding protein
MALTRRVLVAAIAMMAGAMGAADAQSVLRAVPITDLKVIDPIWTTAYTTRNHGYMVFDTLFAMDENFKPQPQMVERFDVSADKLTYTFTLRDGLKWHDGAPVRAADCVASLERWGKRDVMGGTLMSFTSKLETVDDKTFRLVLKEPVGFVLEALGKVDSIVPFMMPERLAKTDPFQQITDVIGSGPFKFAKDQWVPGNKVVYLKNTDYVPRKEPPSMAAGGKVAKVDRVEWILIPEPSTAIAALNNGEVDLFELPPPDLLKLLKQSPNVVVTNSDRLGSIAFMRLNHLHPPFNHPKAREAMLYATNQEDYMMAAFGDPQNWKKCVAMFGCGGPADSAAGSDALKKQNVEKAKELLKESGYKGEPVVLLDATDISFLHQMNLVAAETLKAVGINVQIQAMDFSMLTSRRAKKEPPAEGGWNVFLTAALVSGMMDPLVNAYAGAACDKALFGWPCDDTLEKLRLDWARAADAAAKKKLTDDIQARHMQVVTYIPLGQYVENIAHHKRLEGVIKSPARFYWNIEKK